MVQVACLLICHDVQWYISLDEGFFWGSAPSKLSCVLHIPPASILTGVFVGHAMYFHWPSWNIYSLSNLVKKWVRFLMKKWHMQKQRHTWMFVYSLCGLGLGVLLVVCFCCSFLGGNQLKMLFSRMRFPSISHSEHMYFYFIHASKK